MNSTNRSSAWIMIVVGAVIILCAMSVKPIAEWKLGLVVCGGIPTLTGLVALLRARFRRI